MKNLVRLIGTVARFTQEAAAGNALCQEAIERMNRNLAQGLLNIQYLIDPDVISLGGSISQNPDFIQGVKEAVEDFVETYEEYTVAPVNPSLHLSCRC